ncbi:MAG: hypothetical protein E3J71_00710 [Candidatus Stahlbacteria bacterium]|nr:MAG: hypothetical protein E3J71_00710 [Candidatus Stahlbacteria bacterium]
MAKPRGRKPAEDSNLPDPKVWKWCKHEECQDKVRRFSLLDVKDQQAEMRRSHYLCAVFGEDYCWIHLPEEAKANYKAKIERWVKERRSLQEANLRDATHHEANLRVSNFHKAYLIGANLQKADLWSADLQGAKLWGANLQDGNLEVANLQDANLEVANLQGAYLLGANLQGAYLREANLQKANLREANLQQARLWDANLQQARLSYANLQGAYLTNANLQEADLSGANLQEANLGEANLQKARLWEANLQKADFSKSKLHGCYMYGVLLNDAKYLTWQQVEYTGEEKDKNWMNALDAYRRLKNYFHQQGQYDDEAQAYYRERLMAQRQAWKEKKLGKWFVLFLLNILAGFGEKLWRTVVGAFATILIFSGIYWLAGKLVTNGGEPITKFWHCLYFSVVTFATLGFGDISPALHSTGTQVAAVIEVILGYVFLGMLITIIARKMGR